MKKQKKCTTRSSLIVCIILVCVVFVNLIVFDIDSIGTDVRKIGGGDEIYETGLILPKQLLLSLTVGLSALYIFCGTINKGISNRFLEYVGKRSYSIFIWHQVMIAFYRYMWSSRITLLFFIVFCIVLLLLSELSYNLIEKRFVNLKHSAVTTILLSVLMIFCGGYVYIKAGVVRDVPELDIAKGAVHRGMHAEYVDRIYRFDKDFEGETNRIKVLVQGNSYGRDMVNVLLESTYRDSLDISYIFSWDSSYIDRIKRADYVFTFSGKKDVPDYVWQNTMKSAKIIGIGTKNFGHSNGVIYANRYKPDYYNQTVKLHPWYKQLNDDWVKEWGDDYINFIQIALEGNERVRVFTEEGKYISQDCYHLTPAGAKWYASKINFKTIFK